ncbi:hypothetical protein ACFQ4A_12540 [Lentibacillus salinarum]|uniref:Uncharacterized protein n=1 Tax=Lentibacillus salinarum TaxID=446820 RepID=A0ABW3ZVV8_9BACI
MRHSYRPETRNIDRSGTAIDRRRETSTGAARLSTGNAEHRPERDNYRP